MLWRKKHIFINISWHGGHGPLLSLFEDLEVPKRDKSSIVWRHHSKSPVAYNSLWYQRCYMHLWCDNWDTDCNSDNWETWIHDNLCYLTINSDSGQHSQFLRCSYIWMARPVATNNSKVHVRVGFPCFGNALHLYFSAALVTMCKILYILLISWKANCLSMVLHILFL